MYRRYRWAIACAVVSVILGGCGEAPDGADPLARLDRAATGAPETKPSGYGQATTGCGSTSYTTVSSLAAMQSLIDSYSGSGGLCIKYTGTFNFASISNPCTQYTLSGQTLEIKRKSNITILGADGSAANFGIHIASTASNIIVRNMTFGLLPGGSDSDAISIEGMSDGSPQNIWIDHNELFSSMVECDGAGDTEFDGLVDVKKGADNVTVSYNYLHDHHKVSLNGSSDSDTAVRHITFHHNIFENVGARTPLQRAGYGHMLNNYFNGIDVSGINVRMGGYALIEGNFFENAQNPVTSRDSEAIGYWELRNNNVASPADFAANNITWVASGSTPTKDATDWATTAKFPVSLGYSYTADSAQCVKAGLRSVAGAGKGLATLSCGTTTYYSLTVSVSGNGTTSPAPGTYSYASGSTVSVSATPASGYVFSGWSGACSGTGSCTVTMNAAKSVAASFVQARDTQPPSVPVSVSASSVGTTSVVLTWAASTDDTGVVGYDVYSGSALAGSSSTNTATVSNLLPGTSYTFTVRARDAAGNASSASSPVTVTTRAGTDVTSPSAPSNLVWINDGMTVTMTWGASTDDVGVITYDFFYGAYFIGSSPGTSATLIGFQSGTPYNFTVKARDAAGNVSQASNQITVLLGMTQDTVPPSAPTNLSASNVTTTSLTLRWTASTDNVGVVVYQVFANGSQAATSFGSTSAAVSGLNLSGGSCVLTVKAVDAAGNVSSASAALTVGGPVTGDLIVAPSGKDSGAGTLSDPMSLSAAVSKIAAGSAILLKAGTYSFSAPIVIDRTNSGTSGNLKKLWAYGDGKVVLDFSAEPYNSSDTSQNGRGIELGGSYWHLKGFEVYKAADNGVFVAGSNNIVESVVLHANRDSGLQLSRYSSSASQSEWPSYNQILNCESYDSYDPATGENADGFAAKLTCGPGNVFRGCVSHHNIDDGWDLYTKSETGAISPVTIDQCVAHHNGTLTDGTSSSNGDRNGFKLGGEKIAVAHVVTRSLAYANGKNGFTWNSNPGAILVANCLAWDNVEGNYLFGSSSVTSSAVFTNNVSLWLNGAAGVNDKYGVDVAGSNCWWNKSKLSSTSGSGVTCTTADFASALSAPTLGRKSDGSLDLSVFKLASSSDLANAGVVPSGTLPFTASSYYIGTPDLGVYETR
jgi:pectate lyase